MDFRINRGAGVFLIVLFISVVCTAAPVSIPVKKVSGGEAHTLILTESNNVWSCGDNGYQQLGDSNNINRIIPVQVHGPNDVNFIENIIAIAAGWTHSLALDANNRVWAWGTNNFGQLGIGEQPAFSATPVQVHDGEMNTSSNFLENIICISAGRSGTHSLAVDDSNFVWAWGNNGLGQCGIGESGNCKYSPVRVHGENNDVNGLKNIIAVSAGEEHSMALEKIDPNDPNFKGFVYTWGDNCYGKSSVLGLGKLGTNDTVSTCNTTPVKVHGVNNDTNGLRNIVAISAGWDHSMALEKIDPNDPNDPNDICDPNCKGRVYCWGYGGNGRLGDGTTTNRAMPVIVHDGDMDTNSNYLENIIAISAGDYHCMALDANGYVWTWGDNGFGQLGNGTNNSSAVPVRVVGPDGNGFLSDINYISAGYYHCLAVDKFGRAYVWGQGEDYGQLGIGSKENINIPTPIYIYDLNVHNKTQDKWYKRIQPAIRDANNNDVIIAYEGNYCEDIDFGYKTLILKSIDPDNNSVVANTKLYGSDSMSAISLVSNTGSEISGLTITYNGIYCQNADPIINHCRMTNNNSSGIYCLNASPTITHCTFTNNGAGIYSSSSSNPTIDRCRIENNGNGVSCYEGAAATITNTFLNKNSNKGIYAENADIVVAGCNIADNTTNGYSYGIHVLGGSADIRNNIIHHNSRGIYLETISSAEIRNNTIVYNYEFGIYRYFGNDPSINSNVIWGNGYSNLDVYGGSFGNVNYNCIQNYTGGGTENITSNPQFRDVNDGVDNYHLAYDSNCIDKGDLNFSDANEKDIDGEDRIMDGDNNGVFRVDIGADEFCPYDLSQDGFVNFLDFAVFAGQWEKSTSDVNDYNDRCDFYNDNVINYKDLYVFSNYWLYPSDWEPISGQGAYFAQGGGEEMMMSMESEQEFWSESLAMEESQEDDEQSMLAGEGETASIYLICDVNEPNSGDEVTVQVYSDVPLFCMQLGITVTGDANITSAVSTADCNEYGWDPSWPTDPIIDPTGWVYIGGVIWEADADGVVGYIKFRYNSGQVSVSITEGDAYDADCEPVLFSGEALTFGADPNES